MWKPALPRPRSFYSSVLVFLLLSAMHSIVNGPKQITSQVLETNNSIEDLQLSNCYIDKHARPTNTLDMDTVLVSAILVTNAVQKEAFVCSPTKGQNLNVDIGLYVVATSHFENGSALIRNIEAITCIKGQNATILGCTIEQPAKNLPLVKCATQRPFPRGPMMLSSEVGSGDLSSHTATVEMDSDVIRCSDASGNTIIADLLTFTGVFQSFEEVTSKKSIESIKCMKSIVNLRVLGCNIEKIM
jgi:hypothetical protein